jgi:[ribosomal protein S5]-alanine N-acetyltransferase
MAGTSHLALANRLTLAGIVELTTPATPHTRPPRTLTSVAALETSHLRLTPWSPEHLLAMIDGAERFEADAGVRLADGLRAMFVSDDVSPLWIAHLREAPGPDPWTLGFAVVHRADDLVIGSAAFKGAPDEDGVVEIAYGIAPSHRGQGYATEAARALVSFALERVDVRSIRAHTKPENDASGRVLAKCGFHQVGEVVDPEDGLVWRWERVVG